MLLFYSMGLDLIPLPLHEHPQPHFETREKKSKKKLQVKAKYKYHYEIVKHVIVIRPMGIANIILEWEPMAHVMRVQIEFYIFCQI